MTVPMRIDFVSDVVCPWCVIGLKALEQALANAADTVTAEIHFQPFELNPGMPPEGQDVGEHVREKYGSSPEQSQGTRDLIRSSAAALGFTINSGPGSRIWNTFDCHRLLHWAEEQGRQAELKMALFEAYFTDRQNPGDVTVLAAAAAKAGLDPEAAQRVIASGAYADEVRRDEAFWRDQGVQAVPTLVINGKYGITGGQPVAAFEKAIRSIAAEG